ncbi:MAG: UDP-3-O-(3-hydroxymyristoyl)glucosamine N-acyltransferase [Sneathiella sp.]|nr:UDP-3-O-(3-hydroxymyristoyl)glucosamine N-acyltransferase [Sneathiella sp.]
MADLDFYKRSGPFLLSHLAEIVDAEIVNAKNPNVEISDVGSLDKAGDRDISFLSNRKYIEPFIQSKAGACIVSSEFADHAPKGMSLLVVKDPYKAYAIISAYFYPNQKSTGEIHPTAIISKDAKIGDGVSIGAYTVIENGVVIGDNTQVGTHCFFGENVKIGTDCLIRAHVSVRYSHIGDHVTLYSGVKIGEDGFGFAPDPSGHIKIPQLGRVLIGSNVEIGGNTVVDRGAGPDTIIGDGCWIDNLCQIAHNVKMGRGCIMASQSGIAGSAVLEDYVVVGGQAGVSGHITIGMGAQIGGQAGVLSSVPSGAIYIGFPARPKKEFFKGVATLNRLAKSKRRGK